MLRLFVHRRGILLITGRRQLVKIRKPHDSGLIIFVRNAENYNQVATSD
jgi:hypothetical protein